MEAANVYTLKSDIASMVRDYLETNSISKEEFGKRIGLSGSTVRQYLLGKYNSDPRNIEKAIQDYLKAEGVLEVQETKKVKSSETGFLATRDAREILARCQSCQEYKGLGLLIGKSGNGKTFTLKYYAKADRVCYIECNDGMNRRDLIKAIERALNLPKGQGSIDDRLEVIKDFFSINNGYLLIIDEADKLISKDTQSKLEIIRSIFDKENVGVLIAGEPRLEGLIKLFLPRFANRIDFYLNLKGLSTNEVEEFLSDYSFTPEALKEMIVRGTNSQTGCFRLLDRTYKNVKRLVKDDEEITLEVINKASSMMLL